MRTNKNVRGLIKREGKLLLIHRFKNGSEYWVVPGGGVEEGETLDEALKREMKEETNLDIKNSKFLVMGDTSLGEQYIYECEMFDGEMKLQGPELENMNENNQYILTWVLFEDVKKIGSLYPEIIKDLV